MLTLEKFRKIPAGEIFLTGQLPNNPGGLYMTDSRPGDLLTWVAIKGYSDDWAIYCHWLYFSIDHIAKTGDKVISKDHIRRCVPCDDKVLDQYRY